MREVEYRFQVLRNNVPYDELHALGAPTVRHQGSATITRSLSGTFRKPTKEINWLNDRVRPQMWLDGEWHSLGVFVASSMVEKYANGVSTVALQAMDRALLVKQVSTEGLLHLTAGERYLDVIKRMLLECGITGVLSDENEDVLTTDREDWNEGTSYITIINTLLAEIAFSPIWFDAEGYARLTRYVDLSAQAVDHVYRSDNSSIIAPDCAIAQDIYNPVNVFKVVVSNPDLAEPMTAISENNSITSPISITRLGRRILAPIVRLNNIASQEALQAYADRLRLDSQLADEKITFTTANMPTHSYSDVVALEHERLQGIYQETDWTMQLSYSGKMTHKAKRILFL